MTHPELRIWLALAISIVVHLAPLIAQLATTQPKKSAVIQARLLPSPIPVPPQAAPEPIEIPQPVADNKPEIKPKPLAVPETKTKKTERPINWETAARQQLKKLSTEGLMYSRESIAAGLEGNPEIQVFLDDDGKVVATRIEESSGYALLDRDARNAAARLRFPADAPREIIFRIRFKLP